jgi:hypothetical protein
MHLSDYEGFGRKQSWSNLRHSRCIFLERPQNSAKGLRITGDLADIRTFDPELSQMPYRSSQLEI